MQELEKLQQEIEKLEKKENPTKEEKEELEKKRKDYQKKLKEIAAGRIKGSCTVRSRIGGMARQTASRST